RAGDLLQAPPQAHLPPGPGPSPLRAPRLARAADHRPLLDRLGGVRAARARDTQAALGLLMDLPRHVLVLGFRRTGQAVAAALAARGVRVRVADARPAAALGVTGAPAGVELRLGEDGPARRRWPWPRSRASSSSGWSAFGRASAAS